MIDYQKLGRLLLPIQAMPQGVPLFFATESEEFVGTIGLDRIPKAPNGGICIFVEKTQEDAILVRCEELGWKWGVGLGLRHTQWKPWTDNRYLYLCDNGYLIYSKHPPNYVFGSLRGYPLYSLADPGTPSPEPANNDGRPTCFWCGGVTRRILGFSASYDVCPKCGK